MSDPFLPDDVDPDVARRLAAAFGALATTEVPASAPRPAAPRPVVRRGVSPRRRWGIAGGGLLVAAAAVVLALLLGTEVFDARVATTAPPATVVAPTDTAPTTAASATPTTPAASSPVPARSASTAPPTTAAPDPAAVNTAFAAVTGGSRSPVVTVPGGYEGADLTGTVTIRFWTSTDGTAWRQAGTSVYPPVNPGETAISAFIKAAGLPTGAPHAVFVVSDQYATGDATGVDVSFSDGANGFGAIKGAADGNLYPSGSGVATVADVGASFQENLSDGQLVTIECSTTTSNALCHGADNQITKYWDWSGDAFVLARRTGPAS